MLKVTVLSKLNDSGEGVHKAQLPQSVGMSKLLSSERIGSPLHIMGAFTRLNALHCQQHAAC